MSGLKSNYMNRASAIDIYNKLIEFELDEK